MKEFRPENGKFPMVPRLTPVRIALGNVTGLTVCLVPYEFHCFGETHQHVFVGVVEHGAYQFAHYVHWAYAKEKLGFEYEGDARNFADFLNDQFGWGDGTRQGTYD